MISHRIEVPTGRKYSNDLFIYFPCIICMHTCAARANTYWYQVHLAREEHTQNLKNVLSRLQKFGLRLSEGKCKFFLTRLVEPCCYTYWPH